jgi:hypothetical protein
MNKILYSYYVTYYSAIGIYIWICRIGRGSKKMLSEHTHYTSYDKEPMRFSSYTSRIRRLATLMFHRNLRIIG